MITTYGMSTSMALKLIDRERDTFEKGIREDPTAKREIAAFRERIGSIQTVDDLTKDFEVYSFVMKSFGMEEQMYAKAMVKKIVTSDGDDKKSLVNKLTNNDYKDLHKTLGFNTDGTAGTNFSDPKWIEEMVERFVDQRLIDTQSEVSPSVGIALDFKKNVAGFNNWYQVIADKGAASFMRTALGLPDMLAGADVDAQKRAFEKKMDIADLKDLEKVEKLVSKYAAISSANEAAAQPVSLLTLFNSANASGTWAPITIDVTALSNFRASSYRWNQHI